MNEMHPNLDQIGAERRDFLKLAASSLVLASGMETALAHSANPLPTAQADNFYQSTRVQIEPVAFRNQFAMQIVGRLISPIGTDAATRLPAIIVGHPMGAVKEQSAMLYAQKLAEYGFATLAIDLPYWGESEGLPRNLVAPDAFTEAFSAAADFLSTQPNVDNKQIGVLGICGSGGFAISAAKLDPRLKAVATVSMYDMGAVTRNGLQHARSVSQRQALLGQAVAQRQAEFDSGQGLFLNYLPAQLPADADAVTREFWEFYRTPRGMFMPQGQTLEQTQNRMLSSEVRFMNFYPFNDIETIAPRPLLFISGDQAHSKEFSEDAFRRASGPKELVWVPGAGHVDLYDRVDLIPWGKLRAFFTEALKA